MRFHNENAELRAEGRTITGTLMRYGDMGRVQTAQRHHAGRARLERFLPGSLTPRPSVTMNLRHQPLVSLAWHPGGGLQLEHDAEAVRFQAELPPTPAGELALTELRDGKLTGASVEFYALSERRDGDTRIIAAAEYDAIGLTGAPLYRGSRVELRQAPWIRGVIISKGNSASIYDCDCVGGGPELCRVGFEVGAFDNAVQQVQTGQQNLVLHTGRLDVQHVLGDTEHGAFWLDLIDDILNIFISDAAELTPAGRMVAESILTTSLHLRPIIDEDRSAFNDADGVRWFQRVALSSLLLKAARPDRAAGWQPVQLVADERTGFRGRLPAVLPPEPEPRARRRRVWL